MGEQGSLPGGGAADLTPEGWRRVLLGRRLGRGVGKALAGLEAEGGKVTREGVEEGLSGRGPGVQGRI